MFQDKLLALLAKYKGKFHSKSSRLKLLDGKTQLIEDDTHKITQDIQRMEALLKSYDNKPNQTETRAPSEQDAEEIITPDVVYPIKNKDDTSSPLVIFFVDDTKEIQELIDRTGNVIEPDKENE